MSEKYDFSGYATRNDLLCADGRTIRKDAFKDCDGITVPLVWGHKHGSPGDVLGHALLENRSDGVYTYGTFNNTEAGKNAKELVRHGDVKALSIYANQLIQKGGDVIHGMIREVSLCLAGANPGARIEDFSFEHFDDEGLEFDALVFNGENLVLSHADEPEEEKKEPEKQEKVPASEQKKEETEMANGEKTVKDVFDTLTEEQKNVVYFMIGQALEDAKGGKRKDDDEEDDEVAHNIFENDYEGQVIMHDALDAVLADGKKFGTLKDSYEYHMTDGALAHAIDTTGMEVPTMSNADYADTAHGGPGYGINAAYGPNGSNNFLFPDARALNGEPIMISRNMEWVNSVLNGVHRSPFARVKSVFANITEDEARAKGYIKGNMKKNEFFSLMKRATTPQTVYKKQKMDRDDITDITDFNVVAWIKTEMRTMLNEELARAILIGDGRLTSDDDKISEDHIRPIVSDAPLFTIQAPVTSGATEETTAKNFMKAALRARKDYKGSGNPTLYTTEDVLTNMLLIEDEIGHRLYKSEAEVATALRVKDIVTVPVMEGFKNAANKPVLGIIVNLADYNVGADKGGEINMFDDFNIDYNQYIYLIETRCSGALSKPYSAIVLYENSSSSSTTDDSATTTTDK